MSPQHARGHALRRKGRPFDTTLIVFFLGMIIAGIAFGNHARELWFTQDDAYISYRYAQNALHGDGLVFNVGERVEGYTNFLWVIFLMVGGALGLGFDAVAKTLGLAAGLGLIVLTAIWTRAAWRHLDWGDGALPGAAAALIVGCNGSFAYWAVSGLETVWFAFCATFSVWLWIRRSWLVAPALAVAALTRPEGGMLWGILVLAEWVWGDGIRRGVWLAGAAVILLAPFAVFKMLYYGSLLPNPFYAKTGFSWEYVSSGIEYTWLYLRHYGLYGVTAVLVVASLPALRGRWRIAPAFWLVYVIYITAVGGDVLKNHRFFVPILPVMAVSALVGMGFLANLMPGEKTRRSRLVAVTGVVMALWAMIYPREAIAYFRNMELGLEQKMTTVAGMLKQTDPRPFSIAASTIGKLSYDLAGHRVIDMLGLTDSTIARHPEVIPGNVTTWKERKFNNTYLLSQDPDYILFSTGHKPSAPAERALMLHSRFRRNYYTSLYYAPRLRRLLAVHKRKGDYNGADEVWPSIQLGHDINQAWNFSMNRQPDSAIARMRHIKATGPGDFSKPDEFIAEQMERAGREDEALAYADSALAIDSFSVVAWRVKAAIYQARHDTAGLAGTIPHLQRLVPWLLSR